jgi:hypothetical protein
MLLLRSQKRLMCNDYLFYYLKRLNPYSEVALINEDSRGIYL